MRRFQVVARVLPPTIKNGKHHRRDLCRPQLPICTCPSVSYWCEWILPKWIAQCERPAAQGRSDLQRRRPVPPHGRNSGLHITARLHAGSRHSGSSDRSCPQKNRNALCRARRTNRVQLATRCTRGRSETRQCAMDGARWTQVASCTTTARPVFDVAAMAGRCTTHSTPAASTAAVWAPQRRTKASC